MAGAIEFLLNGARRRVTGLAPDTTVLDYLREHERACGTKEGCAEGDCGACTAVIGEARRGRMRYRAINTCIALLPQLHGKLLLTVEGLEDAEQGLHPAQQAMVDSHASQCGFCTPGFVMSLFAFHHARERPTDDVLHDMLAGNLCRCTGYRPILDAARAVAGPARDRFARMEKELAARLVALPRPAGEYAGAEGRRVFAPRSLDKLLTLRAQHPEARLLAGGTDLGLVVTKEFKPLESVINLGHVRELRQLAVTEDAIEIGAAVTYSDALPAIADDYPSFATLIGRLGSRQIRNLGTIGGNIANASPIGDTPPALIALDAIVRVQSVRAARELPIADFFVDYRRTALAPDEVLVSVSLPRRRPGSEFRTYKISKRHDQDISAVCAAFRLERDGDRVRAIRVAYGGMAATPRRAEAVEAALTGRTWTEATILAAEDALRQSFSPISDFRAGAEYRARVAFNLLRRFHLETTRTDVPLEVAAL